MNPAREWHVSVLLADPPHPYASNPRLTVVAETTAEIYDLVKQQYPTGVVMGIWPSRQRSGTAAALTGETP